jgi:SprT protein
MTLKQQVTKQLEQTLAIAEEKLGIDSPMPTVVYDLKGHTAGIANYDRSKIRLNLYLLEKYKETYIKRTVIHELGHLLSYRLYGMNGRGHGVKWKSVMVAIGGPTTRCHSYETKPARIHKRYILSCQKCSEVIIEVTSRVIKKIRAGAVYTHKGCGAPLSEVK